MEDAPELQQVIYTFLAAQIEFGVYRFGNPLPKMEEARAWFSVSLDTVRVAYHRLKREGYITLTKKAGAAMAVRYAEDEVDAHIQIFFSQRRDAALDLCRTLALLERIGATRSINGVGTLVLSTEGSMEHCDFSDPVVQRRLLDFAESLQILTLTCRDCAGGAFAATDGPALLWLKKRLSDIRESRRYETVVFASLEIVPRFSPIRAVRDIYGELLQVLLWGYPLRGAHGAREEINPYYDPYLHSISEYLDRHDTAGLADNLEEMLLLELQFAVTHLHELGLDSASGLVIPAD